MPENSLEEVKMQILIAASQRFTQYGFNKTTMAEIAADCKMSAGNVYRYFSSKTDIGAVIATHMFCELDGILRKIVKKPNLSASKKIEDFVLEELRHLYEGCSNKPRIMELIEFIHNERKELIENHINTTRSLLAEILAEGNRNLEFEVDDILKTAEIIHVATIKFSTPHFIAMACYSLNELECLGREVVKLLVNGLKKR